MELKGRVSAQGDVRLEGCFAVIETNGEGVNRSTVLPYAEDPSICTTTKTQIATVAHVDGFPCSAGLMEM